MRIDLATLFPEMCEAVLSESIVGRARKKGAIEVNCHQIRAYTENKHGCAGRLSLLRRHGHGDPAQPITAATSGVRAAFPTAHTIYLSPRAAC